MASQIFQVYDTESGRVVSIIKRVAPGVKLAGAVLTNAAANVTVTSTEGLWPGMLLIGKGIPSGTTVSSVDTTTAFTMSAPASAAGSALFIVAVSYIPYLADHTIDAREVHLEHYRDLFNDSTPMLLVSAGDSAGGLVTPGVILYPEDATFTAFAGGTIGSVSVTPGDAVVSISDEKAHLAPREQVQKCSFVHFILDDGALLPVLRKPSFNIVPVS